MYIVVTVGKWHAEGILDAGAFGSLYFILISVSFPPLLLRSLDPRTLMLDIHHTVFRRKDTTDLSRPKKECHCYDIHSRLLDYHDWIHV